MATADKKTKFGPDLAAHQVILSPLVTEKGTHQSTHAHHNAYSFQVNLWANKTQIKVAVEELFNVRVEKVRTQLRLGKKKRYRFRQGRLSNWKKAIVKLHPEDKIEFFKEIWRHSARRRRGLPRRRFALGRQSFGCRDTRIFAMGIRFYKPTTAGRRGGSVSDFAEITDRKKKPEKSLLKPAKKKGGRNFQGVICTRFRGGGHKQMYRIIDFKRSKDDVWATVSSIEYDPNRSARIALLQYEDGVKTYILAPEGLKAGDRLLSGDNAEPRVGNAMSLRKIPLGMSIHNLEMQPGRGGQICRSAGTSATLSAREGKWAQITLPSGEVRRVSADCRATIGAMGNADHMNVSLGKAGRKRWMGRKPHNRGTSMNPVSHPMGGGEGRTAGGRHPCSPTGVLAKGGKTRKKRKPSNAAIIRRRRPGPHYAEK